jgi:hypothetical protein
MGALHDDEVGVVVDRIREKECSCPASVTTPRRFKPVQRCVVPRARETTRTAVRERDARGRFCIPLYIRHERDSEDSFPCECRHRYICALAEQITQTLNQKRIEFFMANRTRIVTYGIVVVNVDLSFRRAIKWRFFRN